MPSRVIHFEIQAGNPERAAKFYEDPEGNVFGLMQADENAK
jgi:predicted enzyme related to lactoylglutathione lyase